MMLPVGHLTLLFGQQVRKDVAFSSLEVTGARLLGDVWTALSAGTAPNTAADRLSGAAQKVKARQAEADALKAGEALSTFSRALSEEKDKVRIGDAGQVAIQKIADGSNLTLDPDVDSYYVMDVVAVRLPELMVARAGLAAAMQPALAAQRLCAHPVVLKHVKQLLGIIDQDSACVRAHSEAACVVRHVQKAAERERLVLELLPAVH
jgi:methyl-accepting chemotaxis protein